MTAGRGWREHLAIQGENDRADRASRLVAALFDVLERDELQPEQRRALQVALSVARELQP